MATAERSSKDEDLLILGAEGGVDDCKAPRLAVMRPNELQTNEAPPQSGALAFVPALTVESDVSEQISSLGNGLHDYLASGLFNHSPPEASESQQLHDNTRWAPVPSLPASYRTEALSLFGNHAVLGPEGVSSDYALSGNLLEDITGVPRVASDERLDHICLDSTDLQQPRLRQKRRRSLEAIRVNADSSLSLPVGTVMQIGQSRTCKQVSAAWRKTLPFELQ